MRSSVVSILAVALVSTTGLVAQSQPVGAQTVPSPSIRECIDPRTGLILPIDYCRCPEIVFDPRTKQYVLSRFLPSQFCPPHEGAFAFAPFGLLNDSGNGGGGGGGSGGGGPGGSGNKGNAGRGNGIDPAPPGGGNFGNDAGGTGGSTTAPGRNK
jgi:hypothetical protein